MKFTNGNPNHLLPPGFIHNKSTRPTQKNAILSLSQVHSRIYRAFCMLVILTSQKTNSRNINTAQTSYKILNASRWCINNAVTVFRRAMNNDKEKPSQVRNLLSSTIHMTSLYNLKSTSFHTHDDPPGKIRLVSTEIPL